MKSFIYVFIGGGLGSIVRYLLSISSLKPESGLFPWHTFVANVIGCFIIGCMMGWLDKQPGHWLLFLLVTGFCGGFTTFSTFSFETMLLFKQGSFLLAFLYLFASLMTCLLFTTIGFLLAESL